MTRRTAMTLATSLAAASALAACGGGGDGDTDVAEGGTGPITIWYSNNENEVAWGEEVVAAWNADNPDQEVTAQEIPAGSSSEEVISAAITAGNTPCLIYNTAPVGVPQFQRQGGLVNLSDFDDGAQYIEDRTGENAQQYTSEDGGYYQLPWKANPVMLFYNKEIFAAAGLDPDAPPLGTHEEFLDTARAIVDSGEARYAIYPAPSAEFYQSWFDFYPFYAAESGGSLLVEDGEATFADEDGIAVAELWRTIYEEQLAGNEGYTGDAFADGITAMASAGPWAIASYGEMDWGVATMPTSAGAAADEIYTFADAKNVAMYVTCEYPETGWEFMKFSTSPEWDEQLLEITGQMPMRTDLTDEYPEYFEANPDYATFAEQTNRTVEVPNVPSSVEVWQAFRDGWTAAVIFGEGDITTALEAAAEQVDAIVGQG